MEELRGCAWKGRTPQPGCSPVSMGSVPSPAGPAVAGLPAQPSAVPSSAVLRER